MTIFYIDTSTNYLYTGIAKDEILLAETKKKFDHDLSKFSISEIDKLLKSVNINPNEIDKIIVVDGPGSFTGIRIGMTFAKIFAWSLKKEITTISSLDAMSLSVDTNKLVIPIINARRGYVYAGVYENGNRVFENLYIKLDELLTKITEMSKEYIFISNDQFDLSNLIKYNPNILKIIMKYKDKESINPHLVEPNYLKSTEAEENLVG